MFITFAICIFASANADVFKNFADDRIYDAIKLALKAKYPDDEPAVIDCMDTVFRHEKIADKFYTVELLTNQQKLQKEIEPYEVTARAGCTAKEFFTSPLGIVVIIVAVIILLGLCGFGSWCLCCRR